MTSPRYDGAQGTVPADDTADAVVFRNVRPFGTESPVDLTVVDGRFTDHPAPAAARVVDGGGRVALPTLVNAHVHPDKTTWGGPWVSRRPAQGIADYSEQDAELFRSQDRTVAERALGLMSHAVTRGTRAMRAHADVAPAYGLACVEGLAAVRQQLRHSLDAEIVAFPQHGVIRTPGTAELLEEAARTGTIDMIGGIDPIDFDHALDEQLDLIFRLADRHALGVDLHLHDRGDAGTAALRAVIDRTRALSLQGRVTVSHVFCLLDLDERELDAIAAELGLADIALTTVAPSPSRVLPIARLREHGVRVGLGTDGVRDAWSPFGNGDMLHRTHQLGRVTGARTDDELERCYHVGAHDGADVLGLPRVDFTAGSPADFVLVHGECLPQIVVDTPPPDLVVRGGRVVARDGEPVDATEQSLP
ncbi:cytosine/adenosine deaminase-related metal-dependent hydrolase [Prauserella sediminis]|uniref:Cytosine/adenosine deaminase-related metal-dependent hydrolase n=1 Tax=Prauserella sediminis TaxID=577680 RepID=A0A839XMY2_9PSEU|nr:amidohydrolase [Prauserella sediminis]MBB3664101.1 cytosine/adenosine deaminase-related metal-dependent hydrolase [Prauserella sediminis]